MKDRLLQIRNSLHLNQEEFGERIGLSKASISALEGGSRNLTDRHVMLLRSELGVNEDWLRTGKGEMLAQSETFTLDEKAQKNNLTELEIDIMKGYMDLPPATRDDLMTLFGSIYSKHAETAATLEPTPEQIAEEEAEAYRQEILAELKTKKSSVSDERKGKSS